ncbi:hypothetical protein PENTCL1PPCAC_24810 [Pristionchus entomophagus]|uniref:G protein-coupled receptor n=1 Tax=Pristionchus entomophagus TaxID=358040 RepID=A0AAV5U6X5_9BILA|nr:hypothetical protein PENTCL1PPCAC_24810 [Pristionchus entomophagus]
MDYGLVRTGAVDRVRASDRKKGEIQAKTHCSFFSCEGEREDHVLLIVEHSHEILALELFRNFRECHSNFVVYFVLKCDRLQLLEGMSHIESLLLDSVSNGHHQICSAFSRAARIVMLRALGVPRIIFIVPIVAFSGLV